MIEIAVKIDGVPYEFKAGGTLDLGQRGLIVWYREPTAGAMRILQDDHAKDVREAIAFVERKRSETDLASRV